ncbi:PQQ-binding-like beta-propeller repeat protein [Streptomyces sp. NPDC048172]|uniref:protein kinase domain-containing protein n=1 Tax=Streptomyces sp. NPDC048172 TaxID=3365505 RepID=UPI00371B2065
MTENVDQTGRTTAYLPGPLLAGDPETIAGHVLLGRLGAGGSGTVYLARTPGGRLVALKSLHPAGAEDPSALARFRRETEAVRALGTLPCFPEAVAAGTEESPDGPGPGPGRPPRPWLATAYVLGPSLAAAVRAHGPWPEEAVRTLGRHLAAALAALHGAGLVHRDVKPSNILLSPAAPQVIDVGVAALAEGDGALLTGTGQHPGTPAYMAPEQTGHAASASGEVGPACDVFALGAVLTYTATGRPPYGEGESGEVLYRLTHEEPELTAVPEALRPLVAACLDRDPGRRPAPAELAERLGGAAWFGGGLPAPVLADLQAGTARAGTLGVRRTAEDTAPLPSPGGGGRITRRRALAGAAALAVGGAAGAAWLLRPAGAEGHPGGPSTPARKGGKLPGGAPRPLWTRRAKLSPASGPFAVLGDTLVVSGDDDALLGLDPRRGTLRWRREVAAGGLAVAGRVVRAGASPVTRLAVVEAADGRTWYTEDLGADFSWMNEAVCAADGDTVYAVGHDWVAHRERARKHPVEKLDRFLVAYDLRARRRRWRVRLAPSENGTAVAAAGSGMLVLLETDAVTAYRARDGSRAWRRELSTEAVEKDKVFKDTDRAVTVADGTVVVTGRGVLVLEPRDGRTVWSLDPEETGKGMPGKPLYGRATVHDRTVYVVILGREMFVTERDRRKMRWRWQTSVLLQQPPGQAPLLAGRYVFPPADGEAAVIAVDRRTHKTAWTLPTSGPGRNATHLTTHGTGRTRTLYVADSESLRALPLGD